MLQKLFPQKHSDVSNRRGGVSNSFDQETWAHKRQISPKSGVYIEDVTMLEIILQKWKPIYTTCDQFLRSNRPQLVQSTPKLYSRSRWTLSGLQKLTREWQNYLYLLCPEQKSFEFMTVWLVLVFLTYWESKKLDKCRVGYMILH